jgi:drug/metabolite transporter (DMT)-like permease
METAKVSALRETSVVFAALMGTWFLREGFGRRRIAAALVLAAGLLLMQFGG